MVRTVDRLDNVNDVLEECKSGDDKAFEKLYALLAPKMLGVCFRYAKDRSEAEDLLHEGFILVFRKIKSFRSAGSAEGWIRRIMVNNAINHVKKNHALKFSDEIEPDSEPAGHVDNNAVRDMAYEDIIEQVNSLSEGYRMVFYLYAVEGYTHKEIGNMLGIAESTSKTQYRMARKRLMEKLNILYKQERRSIG